MVDLAKHAVLEAGPPYYIAEPGGRILHANAAYWQLAQALRSQDAEDAGRDDGHRIDAHDIMTVIEAFDAPLRREHRLLVDGVAQHFLSHHHLLHGEDGAVRAIFGFFLPQTELKETERALALATDRFEDVARLVSGWIWETDRDHKITYVSPGVLQLLGYHSRELTGRPLAELTAERFPPLTALARNGHHSAFRDLEVAFACKEGGARRVLLSGAPVFSRENGSFLGYRGAARDVTELRARETALLIAKESAELADRVKSEFLASISHELRTPLNAIIGFSEVMQEQPFGPIGDQRYRDYLGDILESGRHLLAMINDILDVARIEAGSLELQEGEVDPRAVANSAHQLLVDRAVKAGVSLEANMEANLLRLWADAGKIKQILLNLLSNAVKFTPSGGRVQLCVETDGDGGLRFLVRDTGIGMAPEEIPTALEMFSQVDGRLSRRYEGTGLGLPLSKALAELHGGRLELESEPGRGTTATVHLPAEKIMRPQSPLAEAGSR